MYVENKYIPISNIIVVISPTSSYTPSGQLVGDGLDETALTNFWNCYGYWNIRKCTKINFGWLGSLVYWQTERAVINFRSFAITSVQGSIKPCEFDTYFRGWFLLVY